MMLLALRNCVEHETMVETGVSPVEMGVRPVETGVRPVLPESMSASMNSAEGVVMGMPVISAMLLLLRTANDDNDVEVATEVTGGSSSVLGRSFETEAVLEVRTVVADGAPFITRRSGIISDSPAQPIVV